MTHGSKRPVYPGDQLILELEVIALKKSLSKMKGIAKVDNQVVAEAILYASARELTQLKKVVIIFCIYGGN
jgi:3-hydroxyacyl-[acyl-carrier-protein] dehydratase